MKYFAAALCGVLLLIALGLHRATAIGPGGMMMSSSTSGGGGGGGGLTTPPPGAVAAGFTTLAWGFDIPGNQACSSATGTLVCVPASPLTNWLDCTINGGPAASTPMAWLAKNFNSASPCSDINIINDGGVNVLDVAYTLTDYNNGILATEFDSISPSTQTGNLFPPGVYGGWTSKIPSSVQCCAFTSPIGQVHDEYFYGQNGMTAPFSERDIIELGSPVIGGASGGGPDNNGASGGTGSNPINYGTGSPAGYDQTTYQTYAVRWVFDGVSSTAACTYLTLVGGSPVQTHCAGSTNYAGSNGSGNVFTSRQHSITQVGPFSSEPGAGAPQVTVHTYFKNAFVFSCSGWATGVCNNTTAAVQGVLRGPP